MSPFYDFCCFRCYSLHVAVSVCINCSDRAINVPTDMFAEFCICCRVTDRNEDLFHGNMAPGLPKQDPLNETLQGFCLCDGSAQCGRKAVSDTTADGSEPQRNVRLGVPPIAFVKRRRKRQALVLLSTDSWRMYPTSYKYELQLLYL